MTVVEITDANGAKKKIDVQESGEGLEQLVADLAVKSAVEAVKTALEATLKVQLQAGTNAAGKIVVTTLEGEPKVKVAELPALPTGTNSIGKVKAIEEALPTGTNAIGKISEVHAIAAGTNTIGKVGLAPQTSGGLEIKRVLSAASTNAGFAKSSAGQLFGWYIFNTATAIRYVKIYNKASAPTVGSDTPVLTLPIPKESGTNIEFVNGIAFGTGIAYATTKGVADANSEAVAENDLIINLLYK